MVCASNNQIIASSRSPLINSMYRKCSSYSRIRSLYFRELLSENSKHYVDINYSPLSVICMFVFGLLKLIRINAQISAELWDHWSSALMWALFLFNFNKHIESEETNVKFADKCNLGKVRVAISLTTTHSWNIFEEWKTMRELNSGFYLLSIQKKILNWISGSLEIHFIEHHCQSVHRKLLRQQPVHLFRFVKPFWQVPTAYKMAKVTYWIWSCLRKSPAKTDIPSLDTLDIRYWKPKEK